MEWLQFRDPVSAWSHCVGLLSAPLVTLLLWRASRGDPTKRGGFLVFGATLALCYGCSTLFHAVRRPPAQRQGLATLDYIGVYLFIAGSVTPVALVVLRGGWRRGTLGLAWGMALGGVALRLLPIDVPLVLSTATYVGMGWAVLLGYYQLVHLLPPRAMRLAVLGGLLYSTGAMFDLLGWPILVPGVFGAHELFHFFVLAGTVAHVQFLLKAVAPYAGPAAAVVKRKEKTMSSRSSPFQELKRGLREACAFLHAFTEGQRGFTHQDVAAGIGRARHLCEEMEAQHGTGMRAEEVAVATAAGRQQITEAKVKLEGNQS